MKHLFIITPFSLFNWQPSMAGVTDELEELRGQWIETVNSRSNDIQSLYREGGVLFSEGQFLFGKEQIAGHFSKSTRMIHSAEVVKTYKNFSNRYFDTGRYRAGGDSNDYYVQVWKQQSDKSWRVIFEED